MSNNPYKSEKCEILKITKMTDIEWTFRIATDKEINHGQFCHLSIPKVGEAPISVSGTGEGWIEFTIRSVGKLTSKIFNLVVGDYFYIRGPYGNGFNLEDLKDKHVVIAGGGSGVAPVKTLIDYLFTNDSFASEVDLMFGFKTPNDILFKDKLDAWKAKFKTIITVDNACGVTDGVCEGLITKYVKDIKLSEFSKMKVIIVGPPMMMKFTALEFMKHGVPKENIIVSFERNMSCGLGKCGHCKIDEKYVCLEGPIFNYDVAEKLID